MQTTDRMRKLTAMLEKDGKDPFLPFALGMEHKKLRQTEQAVEWFGRALERDPGYCVAYHQTALAYEEGGTWRRPSGLIGMASRLLARRAISTRRTRWRRRCP